MIDHMIHHVITLLVMKQSVFKEGVDHLQGQGKDANHFVREGVLHVHVMITRIILTWNTLMLSISNSCIRS